MIKTRANGFVPRRERTAASRCLGVLVLTAGLLGISHPAPVSASEHCDKRPTVRIQEWTGDIINIVAWVAVAKGLFEKNCVTPKMIPLVTGPGAITALVNGTIHFSSQAPDGVIRARSKGVDVRLVGNTYAGHWNALVARADAKFPNAAKGYPAMMQDLVGKKIGVTVLGGSTEAFIRSAFEGAGLDSFSAPYVAVGGVNTAVPALRQGSVDAAMMFGTGPELAEALGVGKILLDYRKEGVGPESVQAMRGATLSWVAYGRYIDENPQVIEGFVKGSNEAIEWISDPKNRRELYRIIGEQIRLPDTIAHRDRVLERIVDVNAPLLGSGIPKDSIDGWNAYLMHLKQISEPVSMSELVWRTANP